MFVLSNEEVELGHFSDKIDAFKSAHSLGRIPLVLIKKGFQPTKQQISPCTFWQLKLVTNRIPETTPYTLNESGQFCEVDRARMAEYHDVFEFSGAMSDGSDPSFWLDLIKDGISHRSSYDFGVGAGDKKALFLDRDGVLIHDCDYPSAIDQLKIREGVIPLLLAAQKKDYQLIVISNQSGVARGFFDMKKVDEIHHYLHSQFQSQGVQLTHWYFCPYHFTGEEGPYQKRSHFRKPMPGMFLQAASQYQLNFHQSLMIGDKLSDEPLCLDLKTFFIHDPVKSANYAAPFYPDFSSLLKDLPF